MDGWMDSLKFCKPANEFRGLT